MFPNGLCGRCDILKNENQWSDTCRYPFFACPASVGDCHTGIHFPLTESPKTKVTFYLKLCSTALTEGAPSLCTVIYGCPL